jgi:putative alpha-1,2-mannosidase
MENQYCKVGAITPLTNNRQAIHLLEYQYQNFIHKASNINDAKLVEFFESKAKKVQKILENLV